MHIGRIRITKWHFIIGLPSFLLVAFVMWFTFFRLDWIEQIEVPAGFDFESEISTSLNLKTTEMNALTDLSVSCDQLQDQLDKIEIEHRISDCINSSLYSYRENNLHVKLTNVNSILDKINFFETYLLDVNTHLKNDKLVFPNLSQDDYIIGHLITLIPTIHCAYLFHIQQGSYEDAQVYLDMLFNIYLRFNTESFHRIDSFINDFIRTLIIAHHLSEGKYNIHKKVDTFIQEYTECYPSFLSTLQTAKIKFDQSIKYRYDNIPNKNILQTIFRQFYVNKKQALHNSERMWYVLMNEGVSNRRLHSLTHKLESIDNTSFEIFLYKDALGILALWESRILDDIRPNYELKKTLWLYQASKAYNAVWNYQQLHQVFPDTLAATDFEAKEGYNIYYQKCSNEEFYIMSSDQFDMNVLSEKETLMHEHAYWYYNADP